MTGPPSRLLPRRPSSGSVRSDSAPTRATLAMRSTCDHHLHMSTMVQIRNVPDDIHRQAKARAALAGLTLSEYALQALQRELARPTSAELAARIRTLEPIHEAPSGASLVREARDARDVRQARDTPDVRDTR